MKLNHRNALKAQRRWVLKPYASAVEAKTRFLMTGVCVPSSANIPTTPPAGRMKTRRKDGKPLSLEKINNAGAVYTRNITEITDRIQKSSTNTLRPLSTYADSSHQSVEGKQEYASCCTFSVSAHPIVPDKSIECISSRCHLMSSCFHQPTRTVHAGRSSSSRASSWSDYSPPVTAAERSRDDPPGQHVTGIYAQSG